MVRGRAVRLCNDGAAALGLRHSWSGGVTRQLRVSSVAARGTSSELGRSGGWLWGSLGLAGLQAAGGHRTGWKVLVSRESDEYRRQLLLSK